MDHGSGRQADPTKPDVKLSKGAQPTSDVGKGRR